MSARIVIYCMQADNGLLYRGTENLLILSCNYLIFFFSILKIIKRCVKDFSTTVQALIVIFGMLADGD